jgi:hypothetical protein
MYIAIVIMAIGSLVGLGFSIRNILIGAGKLNNPIYDTEEKRRYIRKIGLTGLIASIVIAFIIIPVIVFVLYMASRF